MMERKIDIFGLFTTIAISLTLWYPTELIAQKASSINRNRPIQTEQKQNTVSSQKQSVTNKSNSNKKKFTKGIIPVFSVSLDTINVSSGGGYCEVTVDSTHPWKIKSVEKDWVDAYKEDNRLDVYINQNMSSSFRSCLIELNSLKKKAIIFVKQEPKIKTKEEEEAEKRAKAIQTIQRKASDGDAESQNKLGVIYANGKDIQKDLYKAFKWFSLSAEKGYDKAQCNLAYMYQNGYGTDIDYKKALHWYHKAADQNYADAQYHLGRMYELGMGMKAKASTAFKYYEKAANQDHASAQYRLGCLYEKGDGCKQDLKKAMAWYSLSNQEESKSAYKRLLDKGIAPDQTIINIITKVRNKSTK